MSQAAQDVLWACSRMSCLCLLLLLLLLLFLIPSGVKITRVKSKVKSKTKSWSGHSSSLEKLLWSKIELKRWIVVEMRWKRKLGSRLSLEIDAILRPSSEKKAIDDWFNGPSVSAAIVLLLLLNVFDDVPVCQYYGAPVCVTDESWMRQSRGGLVKCKWVKISMQWLSKPSEAVECREADCSRW